MGVQNWSGPRGSLKGKACTKGPPEDGGNCDVIIENDNLLIIFFVH